MRDIQVTRYVTPLREGGSMPAVVEADDDGLYVLKFRGAGQGTRALVAELVAGAIAERIGLAIPDRVFAHLDVDLGRTEPDPEIQELIQASGGRNLALDFLPGSVNFDPAADGALVDAGFASRVVWFDAFISNVDRSVRNTNLLVWHGRVWLIDHGASLYFHHGWDGGIERAIAPFPHITDHVLLPWATNIREVDAALAGRLDEPFFRDVLDRVPDDWFMVPGAFGTPAEQRAAYVSYFVARLEGRDSFVEEAVRVQRA